MEIRKCRTLLTNLFNKPIKQSERVYLRWEDINYYVPTLEKKSSPVLDLLSDISASFKGQLNEPKV